MRCLSIDVVVGFVAVIGAGIGEIGRGEEGMGGEGVCGERCEWVAWYAHLFCMYSTVQIDNLLYARLSY